MNKAAVQDELLFRDEQTAKKARKPQKPWKILLVDDEPEIHNVTKLALRGFEFDERPLEFHSAYSRAEGRDLVAEHPDAALILLDVVMEDDHAGLELAREIREELKNDTLRIVLRTGQPGRAPERTAICAYDINDYKEKTELTSQKLYTLMYSSLRSFRDIVTIKESRRGLERIVESLADVHDTQSVEMFARGVMEQMVALFHRDEAPVHRQTSGLALQSDDEGLKLLVAAGGYEILDDSELHAVVSPQSARDIEIALRSGSDVYSDGRYTGFYRGRSGADNLLHFDGITELNEFERHLVDIFSKNIGVAFDNLHLTREIEETQRELVYRLGEAVETRSKETGNHVKRVAEYSRLLAIGYGLTEQEAEIVKMASPLHDVGKIGIPDSILNKPGELTNEEWEIMKTHAQLGHDLLAGSKRPILQAGAVIALDHHEKWDGSGYPNGKRGKEIHIYGRIVALADVFDALGSDRCYKQSWELEAILDLLHEQSGRQFDPRLINAFFDDLDKFIAVRDAYPDNLSAS